MSGPAEHAEVSMKYLAKLLCRVKGHNYEHTHNMYGSAFSTCYGQGWRCTRCGIQQLRYFVVGLEEKKGGTQ